MTWLERRIKELMEQAAEQVLAGDKDHFDYAVSRYRVLKELLDEAADHRKNYPTGDADHDD